jgi:hypothetical protein
MAWKKMNKSLKEAPPSNDAEACQVSLWWGVEYKAGDCNISQQVALALYNRGVRTIGNLWDSTTKGFKQMQQLVNEFNLDAHEYQGVLALKTKVQHQFRSKLAKDSRITAPGTWVGGYKQLQDDEPAFLIEVSKSWNPGNISTPSCLHHLPSGYPIYTVGQQSKTLIQDRTRNLEHIARVWQGPISIARVVQVDKSVKKQSLVYYGVVGKLPNLDPLLWRWKNGLPLMMYSAKVGKELLSERSQLKSPIAAKWRHETVINFQLDWKEIWKNRSQKEAAFLWSVWHQAIATNTWRNKFNPAANPECPLCGSQFPETYIHRFYQCQFSKKLWTFAFTIMHWLIKGTQNLSPAATFTLEQCLFGRRVRLRRMGTLKIWALLRGVVIWGCWILRNDAVFERVFWTDTKIRNYVWDSLLEYGRVDWIRTKRKISKAKTPEKSQRALGAFDAVWTTNDLLCVRSGFSVTWKPIPPSIPLVFW